LWNQLDSTCPVPFAKIFRFVFYPNHIYNPRRSVPMQGRIAIVTDAGRNAVDAGCAFDERRLARGRPSRVVLTPRRRRQVGGRQLPPATVTRRPIAGESTKQPLKPLRAGMPGDPGELVVTTLVCFLHFAHEAAGAAGTRHSPRPDCSWRETFTQNPGESCRGIAELYLTVIACDKREALVQGSEATKQSILASVLTHGLLR